MANLIRMDLYRMRKAKGFWVCLILAFVFALCITPMGKLLEVIAKLISGEVNVASQIKPLAEIIGNPFPLLNAMLAMLSACAFFYADVENGYIKNIAGQMPMKGFTILSKFAAAAVHNLAFAAAGIIGNLIGTAIVQRIVADSSVLDSIRILVLKLVLLQSLCAILLLVVSTFRSKSLGTILAVLFGLGLTSLIYFGISEGLKPVFGQGIDISSFMPDSVMSETPLKTVKALTVAVVTSLVFLVPAVRIFDRKDVK